MGGNPPLGYDVANRKLVVNLAEATTARLIFQRYLDLGCPRLLYSDMAGSGVVSKLRTFGTGEHRGGWPMGRNALNLILKNRVYVGETHHKGAFYPANTMPLFQPRYSKRSRSVLPNARHRSPATPASNRTRPMQASSDGQT
jgi:site-specific DNA recombinase